MLKESPMPFGQLLKKQRKDAGYSLKQLAAKAEFSASYLSLLENNKRQPSLKAIKGLVQVLGLNPKAQQAMRVAAGFNSLETASPETQTLSFLEFLFKLYATALQEDSFSAQSLIIDAFRVYMHPVCLQMLLAFLEALRLQYPLSQQAFEIAKQAYLIQSDVFDKSVIVYAELILLLLTTNELSHTQFESIRERLKSLPAGVEKSCLSIFIYALYNDALDLLAKEGKALMYAEFSDSLLLARQAALLIWLTKLKSSSQYHGLFQKSLAALRAFAPGHLALRQLQDSPAVSID